MIIKRTFTIMVLLPLTISAILLLSEKYFNLLGIIICIAAGFEWCSLSGMKKLITNIGVANNFLYL